jgi:single-stranded DNA-binding protein
MFKIFVTKAIISKGYKDAPALRFSDNSENQSVRFRIGKSVYDKNAKDNRRFVNINVKAFGNLADRIKKMNLDAGSYVNIFGRYDEEEWEDKETKEKRSAPVIIADEVEYGTVGENGKQNGNNAEPESSSSGAAAAPYVANENPAGFTGFESVGGENPYF